MSKKELHTTDTVIHLIDYPSEVLDYTDKWWCEAYIYVEEIGVEPPSKEFGQITRVLMAWADRNHVSDVGCLWDLESQIGTAFKSGPPRGLRQPDDVIKVTLDKAGCVLFRIDDAAMIACKLSSSDVNNLDDIQRIKAAITIHGTDAKPDVIIKEVKMKRQIVRNLLRILEDDGEYSGFARPKPERYKLMR